MNQSYGLQIEAISMEKFQIMLENKDLLPGRKMLLEHMDERFAKLKAAGVLTIVTW